MAVDRRSKNGVVPLTYVTTIRAFAAKTARLNG
jgi:hypothetical protein